MGKSYKKKQYLRAEGWKTRLKHKENKGEVRKVGRIWVDKSDEESPQEQEEEVDEDPDDGPIFWYDSGQSIFIGSAGLTHL